MILKSLWKSVHHNPNPHSTTAAAPWSTAVVNPNKDRTARHDHQHWTHPLPWLTLMAGRWGFTLEAGRRVIAAVTPDCMTIGPKTFPR